MLEGRCFRGAKLRKIRICYNRTYPKNTWRMLRVQDEENENG